MSDAVTGLSETARRFLKALASESRQEIMLLFSTGQELTVGAVAERCGIGQSTASEQLGRLREGGILTRRKEGTTVYYRADAAGAIAALAELQRYLATCCEP